MQFNSFQFLVFFPAVLLVYFCIPRRVRYLWLLLASYWFYAAWNARYLLLLITSTLITFFGSLVIDRQRSNGKQRAARIVLAAVLISNLCILFFFKYLNFFLDSLRTVCGWLSVSENVPTVSILLPVGISFYTFQAIGYSIDVYRGKLPPERNILRYALFVAFFPQLVAGPIERAENLLPQLKNVDKIAIWDFKRVQRGALIMLYGFFLKMMIADRAAIVVNQVFSNYQSSPGGACAIAAVLFSFQIYCDFAGYSYIAIGAARIMGIRLMDNFRAPYLATSIKSFWKRWHISLSTWFMDYLYIPLGGNRKGKAKKNRNLFLVFALSGLWHGASWHFVLWGTLHALFRIAEEMSLPTRKQALEKCGVAENGWALKSIRTLLTFCVVTLAWIFFRAENIIQAGEIIGKLFSSHWQLFEVLQHSADWLDLRKAELLVLAIGILLLFAVDVFRERKGNLCRWFEERCWLFRAGFFLIGILCILMFGIYGTGYGLSTFIYFQF